MATKNLPYSGEQLQQIADTFGTPVFVTSESIIQDQAKKLLAAFSNINLKIFYAMKANFNPHYVKIIKESGIYGIDAVSPNEVQMALDLGYKPEQIIFTPSNPSNKEIKFVGEKKVLQNLGSLSELERFGKIFPGEEVAIRLSPDIGAGEFDKVITGPNESKFGIILNAIPEILEISTKYNLILKGLHCHIGSGFYTSKEFKIAIESLCEVAKHFPTIDFLDFGGGFGVQYHPEKKEINLDEFAQAIEEPLEKFNASREKGIEIRIEPGKYLISESTILLVTATTKKKKNDIFVGVDSGFHHLIRPAMYGAYHHVVNISNPNGKLEYNQIAGNNCETCDIFNTGIKINEAREGDLLAILVAGGYGTAQSGNYNFRELAPEVLIKANNTIKLTRKRQTYAQILENYTEF